MMSEIMIARIKCANPVSIISPRIESVVELYNIDVEELGAVADEGGGAVAKAASVRRRAIIFWLALSSQPRVARQNGTKMWEARKAE